MLILGNLLWFDANGQESSIPIDQLMQIVVGKPIKGFENCLEDDAKCVSLDANVSLILVADSPERRQTWLADFKKHSRARLHNGNIVNDGTKFMWHTSFAPVVRITAFVDYDSGNFTFSILFLVDFIS